MKDDTTSQRKKVYLLITHVSDGEIYGYDVELGWFFSELRKQKEEVLAMAKKRVEKMRQEFVKKGYEVEGGYYTNGVVQHLWER